MAIFDHGRPIGKAFNSQLKRNLAAAEAELDKAMLKELAEGNY